MTKRTEHDAWLSLSKGQPKREDSPAVPRHHDLGILASVMWLGALALIVAGAVVALGGLIVFSPEASKAGAWMIATGVGAMALLILMREP